MTAVPTYVTPLSTAIAPSDALVAYAEALQDAGRTREAEGALRDAITIAPDNVAAYRALSLLLLRSGRDIDAFSSCGTMLSRAGQTDAATLRLAAEILLFLHIRHESLIGRRREPARLDLRSIGIPDAAPLVLAAEFLPRARALAVAAVLSSPRDVTAQCALAECELRAGYVTAARLAAERAVVCDPTPWALVARALANFADHDEQVAMDHLRQPHLTEFVPELGTGLQLAVQIDPRGALDVLRGDTERKPWVVPYVAHHAGLAHQRSVTVLTGPSTLRIVPKGRVVGDLCFVLDREDQALVHGIVDEPDVQLGMPRCHDLPAVLARGRNCVLWTGNDGRLLLHIPAGERLSDGRAFLLATKASANYHHWIGDSLGCLSAMPEVLADPEVRFVVPAPLQPFQVETLAWLGITLDRVVQVATDEIVEFDEVLVVAHRKDGGCTDRSVWRWLRAHLTIPTISAVPAPHRRLFLSGGAGSRHLLNSSEAEAVCLEHGFERVDTSAMTVAQRRDLFSEAAMVVGAIGAGLTDLLFAPPGARTILLGPRSYVVPCYNALADAMGHSVRYVLGAEEPSQFVYPHWDYRIDAGELREAVRAELA